MIACVDIIIIIVYKSVCVVHWLYAYACEFAYYV